MTKISIGRTFLVIAALVGAIACADGVTTPPLCPSTLSLAVGRGVQPSIDWQPGCAVTGVWVIPVISGAALPVWQLTALPRGITPPLRVGSAPSGTSVWGEGSSLAADSVYRLIVVRGTRGASTAAIDSVTFTAQP